ncbi:MAG: single-stranded DNA-binding protein [Chloroflexi bacterium]|nr:single-stranded DNA-binding protein [Chloroflexota bacterium]
MLRVSLLGNLGVEPETRFTQRGAQMTVFRVAVNQLRIGPEGERHENTEWFRVRVIGRQAEYAQRLAKGSRVFVAGRLVIGQYQARDGAQRTSYEVFADEVQSLSARPREMDSEPVAAGVSSVGARQNGDEESTEELEDLPF